MKKMADLTDEQLDILSKDIESGLVMIVERKHYYGLMEQIKELEPKTKRQREALVKLKMFASVNQDNDAMWLIEQALKGGDIKSNTVE